MLAWWAEGTGPKAHTAAAEGGSSSVSEGDGREGGEPSWWWGRLRPSMLAPTCNDDVTTMKLPGHKGSGGAVGDRGGGSGGDAIDSAAPGSCRGAAAGASGAVGGGSVVANVTGGVSGGGAAAASEVVSGQIPEADRGSGLLWPRLFKATPDDLSQLLPHDAPSSPLPVADAATAVISCSGPRPCSSSPSRPAQEVRPAWQLIEAPLSGLDSAPRLAVQAETLPGLHSHPRLADQADLPITHSAARPTVQAELPGLHFFIRSLDEFKQLYVPES